MNNRVEFVLGAEFDHLHDVSGSIDVEYKHPIFCCIGERLLPQCGQQFHVVVHVEFGKCLLKQHPVHGARTANLRCGMPAQLNIQHRFAFEAVVATIKTYQPTLARDAAITAGSGKQGIAKTFDARDRYDAGMRVIGGAYIKLGMHEFSEQFLILAIHRFADSLDLAQTRYCDAGKKCGCYRLALGIEHGDRFVGVNVIINTGDATIFDQNIGALDNPPFIACVHGGVGNQKVLSVAGGSGTAEYKSCQSTFHRATSTSWPSSKSVTGCSAGLLRS